MVSCPYYSHIFWVSYGSGLGIVWVRDPIIRGSSGLGVVLQWGSTISTNQYKVTVLGEVL